MFSWPTVRLDKAPAHRTNTHAGAGERAAIPQNSARWMPTHRGSGGKDLSNETRTSVLQRTKLLYSHAHETDTCNFHRNRCIFDCHLWLRTKSRTLSVQIGEERSIDPGVSDGLVRQLLAEI